MRSGPASFAVALGVVTTLLAGCGSHSTAGAEATPTPAATPQTVFGGDRPVTLQIPSGYDGKTAMPLLLILHGYSVDGAIQEAYMGLGALVNTAGVFVLAPDGTVDPDGYRFWNATDACCNFFGSTVDDVAYLEGLLTSVRAVYQIDPNQIFILGHSNGAFMAHVLACDDSAEIAAIVSFAGATWEDPTKCTPTHPVSVLDIHGTGDDTIAYEGGELEGHTFPGEMTTLARWQGYDSCAAGALSDNPAPINIVPAMTTTSGAFTGCAAGIGVELWTTAGGPHAPIPLATDFATLAWGWLAAHPKP